jgi:hypothetical protein
MPALFVIAVIAVIAYFIYKKRSGGGAGSFGYSKVNTYRFTPEEAERLCWAKWDDYYYPGVVKNVSGSVYSIQYLDGATADIDESLVYPFIEVLHTPGLRYEANWQCKGGFFPCNIIGNEGYRLRVQYIQDGVLEMCEPHQMRMIP